MIGTILATLFMYQGEPYRCIITAPVTLSCVNTASGARIIVKRLEGGYVIWKPTESI